ncbi:hypothetical protein AOXY_G12870 [Acipenser oxyrinchus oxyrinchus]|uniref:Uncharacterized protein n=1 Tax=Acipenser oxyrinchus oxyrinchus TaxID=40147 RepID=A0AAD8DAW3_ACIOX|nr:hypothetical protein AOXY_G12870 [Acipenser oxyrinchus oxyrinchus]
MARLNWCLATVISWGKFLFTCFFPLRVSRREKPEEFEAAHSHTFRVKIFKKGKHCAVCKQTVSKEGLACQGKTGARVGEQCGVIQYVEMGRAWSKVIGVHLRLVSQSPI